MRTNFQDIIRPFMNKRLKIFYFIIQIHHTNMFWYHTPIFIRELYPKLNNMSTNDIKATKIKFLLTIINWSFINHDLEFHLLIGLIALFEPTQQIPIHKTLTFQGSNVSPMCQKQWNWSYLGNINPKLNNISTTYILNQHK